MRFWSASTLALATFVALPLQAQVVPPIEQGTALPERSALGDFSAPDPYPDSVPRLLGFLYMGGPLYSGSWDLNHAIGLAGRYRLTERWSLSAKGQIEMENGFRDVVRFFPAIDVGYALSSDQSTGVFELRSGPAVLDGRLWWTAGAAGMSRPLGPEGIGRVFSVWFDTRAAATGAGLGMWIALGLGVEFPEFDSRKKANRTAAPPQG